MLQSYWVWKGKGTIPGFPVQLSLLQSYWVWKGTIPGFPVQLSLLQSYWVWKGTIPGFPVQLLLLQFNWAWKGKGTIPGFSPPSMYCPLRLLAFSPVICDVTFTNILEPTTKGGARYQDLASSRLLHSRTPTLSREDPSLCLSR